MEEVNLSAAHEDSILHAINEVTGYELLSLDQPIYDEQAALSWSFKDVALAILKAHREGPPMKFTRRHRAIQELLDAPWGNPQCDAELADHYTNCLYELGVSKEEVDVAERHYSTSCPLPDCPCHREIEG